MAFVSPRMSLKVWNDPQDAYDHEQLGDNFLKLDQHDHSQGRGTQIGSGGIAEGAITSTHIFPGALGTVTLDDESVTQAKLAQGARVPIGAVIDWFRPANTVPVPTGFVICTGQTLAAEDHDFPVGGAVTIPDLRNAFVLGADSTKAQNAAAAGNDAATGGPGVGGTGGSNTHTLTVAQLANHNHTFRSAPIGGGVPVGVEGVEHLRAGGQNPVPGELEHAGENEPHNNMPRYVGLLKIMKVQ